LLYAFQLIDTESDLQEMERWLQSNPVSSSNSAFCFFLWCSHYSFQFYVWYASIPINNEFAGP